MEITHIKAEEADYAKQHDTRVANSTYDAATDRFKFLVLQDYTLVRAMQDKSVPIGEDPEYTKDLLGKIAENISNIRIVNKRYEAIIDYFAHPVRKRIEASSAQEFDQMVLTDKDSILSRIDDVRVGDAVDFVLLGADKSCVRLSRVYLDDNHNWVSLDEAPYVTGWKATVADPVDTFKLFTELVD